MKMGVPGFVGGRLTQAREAMGLSQSRLAEQLGMSKQAISRYESGTDSPIQARFNDLANLLQQDHDFFLRPLRPLSNEVTFYRRLKKVKVSALKKVAIKREWYEEIVRLAAQYLELPKLNLPDLFIPHDPFLIDMEDIERASLSVREHWGLGQRPIGNLVRQMERNGLVVSRFSFGVDNVDGFSVNVKDYSLSLVALNTMKSNAFRSRFDAAHELGHHILHQHVTAEMMRDPATYDLVEKQAHRFASSLLMPRDAFRDDIFTYKIEALLTIKEKWNVSLSAILYRMKDMGLIDDDMHQEFRKTLSSKRWSTKEPLDDQLKPEKPALLAQAIEILVKDAGFTKQDILDDLKLKPEIIIEIAELEIGYFDKPEQHTIGITNLRL